MVFAIADDSGNDKANVWFYFSTDDQSIFAPVTCNGVLLGNPEVPINRGEFGERLSDAQRTGDDPLSIEVLEPSCRNLNGKVAIDVMTLRIEALPGWKITSTSLELYEALCGIWMDFWTSQCEDGLGIAELSVTSQTSVTLTFVLDTRPGFAFPNDGLNDPLFACLQYVFAEWSEYGALVEFEPSIITHAVNVGIYTDGEESGAGGSVQVTYPSAIETTTQTLTSSSTLDVAELDEDNPFIITPIPNEGYELESFYGDGAINVTSLDQLQDAYNIHFIRSDSKWEGEGSKNSPYKISNKPQLVRLANVVNNGINFSDTHFEQTSNIRIGGSEWTPIGKDYDHLFTGHYNGNGYKIQGITINSADECIGLFGYVENGIIENVSMENGQIRGLRHVGSVVGYLEDSEIINCKSNVKVMGIYEGYEIGGIVGTAYYGENTEWGEPSTFKTIISNCYFSGVVSGDSDYIGGIAGNLTHAILKNSICDGTVSSSYEFANIGGLIGFCEEGYGIVTDCIFKGVIRSAISGYAGGIGGDIHGSSITNCAVYGYIYTDIPDTTGVFVGYSHAESVITGCSFSGTCNTDDIAPFVADGSPTITACYVWLNNYIKVYSDDTSDWGEYYGLAGAMNKGLPMQRSIFAIVSVSPTTTDDILALFSKDNGWTKFEA